MPEIDEPLKTIAKGAGIFFVGLIISKLLNYFYKAIVARFLGPAEYGLLSLGLAVLGIGGWIALLGLNQGAERYVGYYTNKKNKIKEVISSVVKIGLPFSIIIALIIFLTSKFISSTFFNNLALTNILRLFSIAVIAYSLSEIFLATLRGLKLIRQQVYVKYIAEPLIRLILTLIFLVIGLNLIGAVLAYVLALFFTLIISFFLVNKKFKVFSKIKSGITSTIFSFSWPLLFTGLLFSIFSWTDTLMLGYFKSEDLVGIYNASFPTAYLITTILVSFTALFIPIMANLYANKKYDEIIKVYKKVTKWIFSLSLPIFILIIFFSDNILNILFGKNYIIGSNALIILSIGFFTAVLVGPAGEMFNIIAKTKIKLLIRIFATVLNIILNFILIPDFGLEGAAIATTTSIVILNVLNLAVVYKFIKVKPYDLSYFKPLFAVIISIGVVLIAAKNFNLTSLLFLIASFIIFGIIYLLLILLFKYFDIDDVIIIKSLENKIGIKSNYISNFIKKFI